MKKNLIAIALCFVCAVSLNSCNKSEHCIKYDNGNEDIYFHEENTADYVITMKNGDNTDGKIKLKDLISSSSDIQNFKVYQTIEAANPKMSKEDHIVRLVKQSWIYAKQSIKYPASVKFNDNDCDIMIMDGTLYINYQVFCKNGFGTEDELKITIKYEKQNDETVYDILTL